MSAEQLATLKTAIPAADVMGTITRRDQVRAALEAENEVLRDVQDVSGPERADAEREPAARVAALTADLEALQAQIDAAAHELGLPDEAALVSYVTERFPALWDARALAIANALLDQNEALLDAQERRYDYANAAGSGAVDAWDAVNDLRRADEGLAGLASQVNAAYGSDGPKPTLTFAGLEQEEAAGFPQDAVGTAKAALLARWRSEGTAHAMLFAPDYRPGALCSVGDEQLVAQLGGYDQEIRENIAATRENLGGDLSLYELVLVPELTWQQLGVDPAGVLGEAVAEKYAQVKIDEETLRQATDALVLAATVLGTALGGPIGGAIASASVGGLVGAAELAADLSKLSAVEAAQRVSSDPDFARMTNEDPDLVSIVTDLVSIGLSLVEARSAAAGVRAEIRAFMLSQDTARFHEGLRVALGSQGTAERYAQRFTANLPGPHSPIVPGAGMGAHNGLPSARTGRPTHALNHVGQTEAQLRSRLAGQSGLKAASTFQTRAQGEALVAGALDVDQRVIAAWLPHAEVGDRVTVSMTGLTDTGLVLERGAAHAVQGTGVKVIIEKMPNTAGYPYTIITAYPSLD
ncbi:MAG: RNase A-like domain-containing protein [Myxococcota bacterium]